MNTFDKWMVVLRELHEARNPRAFMTEVATQLAARDAKIAALEHEIELLDRNVYYEKSRGWPVYTDKQREEMQALQPDWDAQSRAMARHRNRTSPKQQSSDESGDAEFDPENWGNVIDYKTVLLQFIASLTLSDHLGDVHDDINSVLEKIDMVLKWNDPAELGHMLANLGITTLHGTKLN